MGKWLGRLSHWCLVLSLGVIHAVAQEQPLTLNSRVERELAGGQTHLYTLHLNTHQIAQVVVEPRGIDVIMAVRAPDGKKVFEVGGPTGAQGHKTATIFAPQKGVYHLEVRALEEHAPAGPYQIRFDRFLTESEYLTERLAALGRLWGALKYFHPYLAYKDIDLDEALIRAIPPVKAARTPAEYRQAISHLLQVLDDPATIVEPLSLERNRSASPVNEKKEPSYFRVVDGFVVVRAADWAKAMVSGNNSALTKQPQMMAEVGKAKGVVLDCRYAGISVSELPPFYLSFYLDNALPSFVRGPIALGTDRYRMHNGYAPQQGNTSGGYSSSLVTQAPGAINGQAQNRKPLAVIIDEKTPNLIPLLSGLQAAGAKIVQVGQSDSASGVRFHPIPLTDGVRVKMRITEFVHPDGGPAFQADVQVPDDMASEEKVISAALAALTNHTEQKVRAAINSPPALAVRSPKDAPYSEMNFPSEEYRLLALFRFWNVIHYFFPYKHLTDKPWSMVLTEFIPRFLENKSALDYEMTVAEMVARIQDTHGFVRGLKSLDEHLGTFAPPLTLKSVGGHLAIVRLLDESAAQAAGLKVGDVILTIDGEPTAQRIAYLSKFRALSTPQAAYRYIYPSALRGAKDSKVKLRVQGADGPTREIELTRTVPLGRAVSPVPRNTPVYQKLPSGQGYIDLARLPLADAHKALDAVMDTPALIFDMRGYPNGTAWPIAPRLTEKKDITAALFRRPIQSALNFADEDLEGGTPAYTFEQKLPPARGAHYRGKVAMLINEDAISQAEHTCLFFESATQVTFIGSPTNGANGDVTNLVLPGGIYVNFSGHDVRHADGRPLQRVGIQPHIKVEPTIAGIREGRDEVLEAAVKFLNATAKNSP